MSSPTNKPEVIATRETAEGHSIKLWSDGSLTWTMNQYVAGSPRARTPKNVELALRAGWLVLGDVELYNDSEVPSLVEAARWAAESGLGPGEVRERAGKILSSAPVLHPTWTVLEADRDGFPTVRVWRLPRIRWPGLAVWLERGTYTICRQLGRSDTYESTGFAFTNLADVSTFLHSQK